MTYPALRQDIIAQWRADLIDNDFGIVFNADYSIITNADGKMEGDAALFLAYRNANITSDDQLVKWYEAHPQVSLDEDMTISERIVRDFTGIPIEDARKLMWPQALLDADYDLSKITPQQFLQILDMYLGTGTINWSQYLAEDNPEA
jgi:hypothetical protein